MPRHLRKIGFGVVLLVLIELGLRIAGTQVLYARYWDSHNTPYKDGDINVVCLGESTTAGLWVDPNDSYPKQLERKLRARYSTDRIRVIVPPHVGQNSSQQANRISDYLDVYKPRLLIVMSGANNEWALSESHITKFIPLAPNREILRLHALIWLDQFRTFKLARYLFLRASSEPSEDLMIWGHPEWSRWPPKHEVFDFALEHRSSFIELWHHDIRVIAAAARQRSVPVLLMSYPVLPTYLPASEFRSIAAALDVPLVENHATFDAFRESGTENQYVFEKDHWHPNAAGYDVVSGNALKAITGLNLLHVEPAKSLAWGGRK